MLATLPAFHSTAPVVPGSPDGSLWQLGRGWVPSSPCPGVLALCPEGGWASGGRKKGGERQKGRGRVPHAWAQEESKLTWPRAGGACRRQQQFSPRAAPASVWVMIHHSFLTCFIFQSVFIRSMPPSHFKHKFSLALLITSELGP